MDVPAGSIADLGAEGVPIGVKSRDSKSLAVVASRTHMTADTQAFIERASEGFDSIDLLSMGSSLKLCLVAEGKADLYPRYAPTMEWDSAAGHAVVRAAGGEVWEVTPDGTETSDPLRYNKESLVNPWFVARAW